MAKAPLTEKAQDSVNDNNISIVMVQGSFQLPLVYEKLSNNLLARGYPVTHPQLPSCTNPEDSLFPTRTLADDASVVQKELENQVEKDGRTVMVVMHSYGGLVGSESIPEKLSHSVRKAQGLPGGVIHLFYFCAFLLEEGQSVLSVFGESPNNDVRVTSLCIRLDNVFEAHGNVHLARRSLLPPEWPKYALQRPP